MINFSTISFGSKQNKKATKNTIQKKQIEKYQDKTNYIDTSLLALAILGAATLQSCVKTDLLEDLEPQKNIIENWGIVFLW